MLGGTRKKISGNLQMLNCAEGLHHEMEKQMKSKEMKVCVYVCVCVYHKRIKIYNSVM